MSNLEEKYISKTIVLPITEKEYSQVGEERRVLEVLDYRCPIILHWFVRKYICLISVVESDIVILKRGE